MSDPSVIRLMSVHWGLGPGGVANYSIQLESVAQGGNIDIRSLVLLRPGRQVDEGSLVKLTNKRVVRSGGLLGMAWLKALRAELTEYQPHLVVSHGFNGHFLVFAAILLGWLKGLPVATYHGPYHPMTRSGRIKKFIFDGFTGYYLRRHANAVVAVAGHEAENLADSGVEAKKITVIHNGIPDVEPIRTARESIRLGWGIASGSSVIGIVSRLEPVKGVSDAIDAMKLIVKQDPSARMVIAGVGTQEAELKKQVALCQMDSCIHFAGFRSDVAEFLSAIDIFLLPSHSECHSIALLEAMRAGKPIVATAVGGNVETVVDGKEAVLVPVQDPRHMADAVLGLVENHERAQSLAAAARQRFLTDFTAEVSMARTATWLRECAENQ